MLIYLNFIIIIKKEEPFKVHTVFNPIAHRKAKIVCNFGLPECNMVKSLSIDVSCKLWIKMDQIFSLRPVLMGYFFLKLSFLLDLSFLLYISHLVCLIITRLPSCTSFQEHLRIL